MGRDIVPVTPDYATFHPFHLPVNPILFGIMVHYQCIPKSMSTFALGSYKNLPAPLEHMSLSRIGLEAENGNPVRTLRSLPQLAATVELLP